MTRVDLDSPEHAVCSGRLANLREKCEEWKARALAAELRAAKLEAGFRAELVSIGYTKKTADDIVAAAAPSASAPLPSVPRLAEDQLYEREEWTTNDDLNEDVHDGEPVVPRTSDAREKCPHYLDGRQTCLQCEFQPKKTACDFANGLGEQCQDTKGHPGRHRTAPTYRAGERPNEAPKHSDRALAEAHQAGIRVGRAEVRTDYPRPTKQLRELARGWCDSHDNLENTDSLADLLAMVARSETPISERLKTEALRLLGVVHDRLYGERFRSIAAARSYEDIKSVMALLEALPLPTGSTADE